LQINGTSLLRDRQINGKKNGIFPATQRICRKRTMALKEAT
jgi:hypothetical protein